MLPLALAAGLALLVVGGLVERPRLRATGPAARPRSGTGGGRRPGVGPEPARTGVAFTPVDYRDPARILDDDRKLANAFVLVLEATLVAVAATLSVAVALRPGVGAGLAAALVATVLVGGTLVGRGMYARLGLDRAVPTSVEGYRDSLSDALGPAVAGDFAEVHDAVTTARGETALDGAAVAVLAAARNGADLDAVARWGESVDLAVADTVEARAKRLAAAGVVDAGGDRLRVADRFDDATPEQLATVAASVLD